MYIEFIRARARNAARVIQTVYEVIVSPKSFASKIRIGDKEQSGKAAQFLVGGFALGVLFATIAAYSLGSTHVLSALIRGGLLFFHAVTTGFVMWVVLKVLLQKDLSFTDFAHCFSYAVGATAIVGSIVYSSGGLYALRYPIFPSELRALGIPESGLERLFCQTVQSVECQGVLRANRQLGGVFRFVLILANLGIAMYTTYVLSTLLKYSLKVPRWKTFVSLVVVLGLSRLAWSTLVD